MQCLEQARAWRSFTDSSGPQHVLAPWSWGLQGWQEEVGRASRAARPGSEAGAANLLSLLLCASVHVVGGLKLGLHSLIIYLGKEEEAGEPRGIQETKELGVLPRSLKTRDQLPLEEL